MRPAAGSRRDHRATQALQRPAAWIRRELGPMIDDLVLDGTLVRSGFLQRPALERLVAEDRAGVADRSKELWQLLTMEVWLDEVGSGLGTQLGTGITAGRR